MKTRRITFILLMFIILTGAITFNSCSDDSIISPPPPPNTVNLIRLDSNYVLGASAIMALYGEDSMHTGYNPVYIVLYDSVTNALITNAHISFEPLNHGHSSPYENPAEDAVEGKFKGALVLTQSFTDNPVHWHIGILVHNHQHQGEPEGEYSYSPGRVRDNPDKFKSIIMPDSTALYLSYIAPNTPVTGSNSLEFLINKNEPELFPSDGTYTIQMTPEFLSTGHTTANNVNPVGNTVGHYNGTMILDQSGTWRIKLKVMKNTLFYDTYFDITY